MSEGQLQTVQRSPVALGRRGIELASMDDLARFSMCVAKSGLAPKGMEKPESIAIAVEMGLEIGLRPMQALQNIAVINGRPAVWGDAMLALCQNCDLFDHAAFEETLAGSGDAMEASCTVRRLPDGKPVRRTFSVAKARRANLWGKAGPWTQYPERMLQMRARSQALRDTFPDVLRGLYTVEELQDVGQQTRRAGAVESIFQAETGPQAALPAPSEDLIPSLPETNPHAAIEQAAAAEVAAGPGGTTPTVAESPPPVAGVQSLADRAATLREYQDALADTNTLHGLAAIREMSDADPDSEIRATVGRWCDARAREIEGKPRRGRPPKSLLEREPGEEG